MIRNSLQYKILFSIHPSGCFPSLFAVVTNKMSKLSPPNARDVTCVAGKLISITICPVLDAKIERTKIYIRNVFPR